jgi:hypothetical protein
VGRDGTRSGGQRMSIGFNPRARVGRDCPSGAASFHTRPRFNPRARVGRDPNGEGVGVIGGASFNPRARVGRDHWSFRYLKTIALAASFRVALRHSYVIAILGTVLTCYQSDSIGIYSNRESSGKLVFASGSRRMMDE